MQKRLLCMLAIGGVAVFCFTPNIARAEDGTHWHGNIASNIDFAEPAVPSPLPTNPAPNSAPGLQPAETNVSDRYRSLIDQISRNNGVDPDLIDAMIQTESNYNPWAVSSKGARGLMQLIPETGRRFGVLNPFDPQQNIEGGVRYIKYLLDMFGGNIDLSLAAYNAGENVVARLGKIPPYPETRNYVRKIRAVYTKPSAATSPLRLNSVVITQPKPIASSKLAPMVAAGPPDKIQETPIVPVSNWLDERGVRHFSNIEPLK